MAFEKPTDVEDKFFLEEDEEKIQKLRAELDRKRKADLLQKRKETHFMKCPKCGADLDEINYQNVLIDRCNECKGIWLDQGELDILVAGHAQITKGFLKKLFG